MSFIRKRYKILILLTFFSTIIFSIIYLFLPSNNLRIQNYEIDLQFNGENAFSYIEDQLNIGFRIPGTPERANCANYFISKFKEININFTYILHNFTVLSIECQNVLFKLNEGKQNIIILGAHYDSRAKATKDPILTNRNNPVPGANDAASGSAVLIELARTLYSQKDNLSCQIWFLFFDAEDQGRDNANGIDGWDWCEGSQVFVNEINSFYDSAIEDFDCMILLDMVGGINLQFINEQYSTSSLLDELFLIGRKLSYTSQFPSNAERRSILDDHKAFVDEGIPAADLIINFWDNPNWPYHHTIQDNISHISDISLETTGKTVEQFIYNNFFEDPNNLYKGNYPWVKDINKPSLEFLISIISIIIIIAITIVILIIIKKPFIEKVENS